MADCLEIYLFLTSFGLECVNDVNGFRINYPQILSYQFAKSEKMGNLILP